MNTENIQNIYDGLIEVQQRLRAIVNTAYFNHNPEVEDAFHPIFAKLREHTATLELELYYREQNAYEEEEEEV